MRLDPRGTPDQRDVLWRALQRCRFPWENYDPERVVPIDFADLSRYVTTSAEVAPLVGERHVIRYSGTPTSHHHDHEGGADPLEVRGRVLGLAYYSGRIEVDTSLRGELLAEVLLSELAHMIDFFGMTDRDRVEIWNALHPGEELDLGESATIEDAIDLGHAHSWFDVGSYYSWVGEAWMGLFVRGWSDVEVTIDFPDHPPSDDAVAQVRAWFTPEPPVEPPVEPVEPEQPTDLPPGCRESLPSPFRRFVRWFEAAP